MTGLEFVGATLVCMLVGFGMGREWQRVFGQRCIECGETFTHAQQAQPECPVGDPANCGVCSPEMPTREIALTCDPFGLKKLLGPNSPADSGAATNTYKSIGRRLPVDDPTPAE